MRTAAGGCESWNAEYSGSGVSVAALSSYSFTSARTSDAADACCAANASASNSCRREYSDDSGASTNVNTGSARKNRISATPGRSIAGGTPSPS